MRKPLAILGLLAALCLPADAAARHKLLVISVDGLDWRYLRDADALGLKMPNIRKLIAESQVADGVVGVWPTITWPSHTTMLTGEPPVPARHPGQCRRAAGHHPELLVRHQDQSADPDPMRDGGGPAPLRRVNWPVTVEAKITWNLPEVYAKRNGDFSDLDTVDRYGTPGLVAEITRTYPSFAYRWLDDRTRTLATIYLLKRKQPDLMLLHLAELDSEAA